MSNAREDLQLTRRSAKRWLEKIRRLHIRNDALHAESMESKPLVFVSTVNGYHQFRATPPIGTRFPMICIPEPTNPFDRFACIVKGPNQEQTPLRFRTQSDVTFGRVPKHICNVISVGMRTHKTLLRASCIYLGHMVHGGQGVGGGPKLVCMYLLEYNSRENIAEVANHLRRYVNEDFIFL